MVILLVLELADIARFPSAKHVTSYIGLMPRVRASADRVRTAHVSKEGNRRCAGRWSSRPRRRRPGPLRAWFRGLQRRKGTKIAWVAVARRLAEIAYQVYQVWKEDSDYIAVLRRTSVRG